MNVPSAKGSLRRSPSSRSTPARASCGEERADVDADSRRAPVRVPEQRAAAAASEIDDAIAGPGARKSRSMSLRILDPRSGGETRSCRASACSASSRYFVCSANSTDGRRSRYAVLAARYRRPHPEHVTCSPFRVSRRSALGTPDEREQPFGNHRRPPSDAAEERLEPLGAPIPGVVGDRCRPRLPRAGRRAPDPTGPGGCRHSAPARCRGQRARRGHPASAPRASPGDPRPRSAVSPPCTRTASAVR